MNRALLFNNVSNVISNVLVDLEFPNNTLLSVYDLEIRNATTTGQTLRYFVVNADYALGTTYDLILCSNSTSMTVSMWDASASGMVIQIKNVSNVGSVTLDANVAGSTIDDELTQTIGPYENIVLCDVAPHKWAIL